MRNSPRYPYTYAADYLRMKVGDDYGKGLISRGAAAQVQTIIAKALAVDKETISKALAELYILENDAE